MKLKQIPEDFIVREIPGFEAGVGNYAIFKLKKINYTTERAIQAVCNALNIHRKRVGYAGIKDKQAVTEQFISVESVSRDKVESLSLKDIELEFTAFSSRRISLGDLKGNSFDIVVRDLPEDCGFETSRPIKNYFDEQRFSKNNAEIGKAIVKKDFKSAVEWIIQSDGDYESDIKSFLVSSPNDFVGALRLVPRSILLLFVHAYQSYLFNKIIDRIDVPKRIVVPLIGFGTECRTVEMQRLIRNLLRDEGLDFRDFVINAIPEISSEGGERDLYVEPENLEIGSLEPDELNKGRYKVRMSFSLSKGAYATNVVKQIILS